MQQAWPSRRCRWPSSRASAAAGRTSVAALVPGRRVRCQLLAGHPRPALQADPAAAAAAAAAAGCQPPLNNKGGSSLRQRRSRHPAVPPSSVAAAPAPSFSPTPTPTPTSSSSSSSSSEDVRVVDALVIGSGPAGLATALMLERRGWTRIVVLEQLPNPTKGDPSKSYLYGIDGRGFKALDMLGLSSQVMDSGIAVEGFMRVPVSGPPKTFTGIAAQSNKRVFCMPRAAFLGLLLGAIKAAGAAIQVMPSSSFLSFSHAGAGAGAGACSDTPMRVHTMVQGSKVTYEPTLLVAADGVQSGVRRKLHEADPSGRFKMHKVSSPAAGLQIRGMLLPPNPTITVDGHHAPTTLPNHMASMLVGKNKLVLSMFATKDPSRPRIATLVQKPDHPLWSIRTTDQLYSLLESSFPQLPIRQLLTQQQAVEFVSSCGVSFPRPQYCPTMHTLIRSPSHTSGSESESRSGPSEPEVRVETSSSSSQHQHQQQQQQQQQRTEPGCGEGAESSRVQAVLLVGDAVHCFPPDLGQGVNSALEDIHILDQVMTECGGRLELALPLYEQRRMPDIKALTRIMQFGNPFQYNQDRMGRALWTLNFMLRSTLNKLLPWLVSPPAVMMIMDPTLSYSQVLSRATSSTRRLWMLAGLLAVLVTLVLSGRTA